jgi:deazaflavin-dependent oxidoreductase (nitroreductase family)
MGAMEPQMMTPAVAHAFSHPVHATGAWAVWWRAWYRLIRLAGWPLTRLALGRGFGNVVVLRVAGRRTGRARELPLGLLSVGERRYVGHPNGDTAWTLNLRAAGTVAVAGARVGSFQARPVLLEPGDERDAVVRATFRQHPFPGNAFYRLAARHVFANGVFFRLELIEGDGPV